MKAKRSYRVGMYLRLSREDAAKGALCSQPESGSIASQREVIRSFIGEHDDMELYDIYVDDGYSGANLDRPEWKRMMADVEAGNLNCIIVRDLSRLSRDYIEAGRLIQKTFPAFQVRFIALMDGFDSLTADRNETSFLLPVRNLINDAYCRDISERVRSHQRIKRENGKFIGAFAVYGYCKDSADKNRLLPDAYPAQIVRKIFAWKLDGMSTLAIADKLNAQGVLSPMEYKRSKGEKFSTGFCTGEKPLWSAVAVKRILQNEIYTGVMVQGKSRKISCKMARCEAKPKEEWVRKAATHPAIVSCGDYEIVQRLLQTDCRAVKGETKAHPFSGLLFCGDCGESMVRRINRYKGNEKVCFICSGNNGGRGCSRHTIPEGELYETVFLGLKGQLALFLEKEALWKRMEQTEASSGELACFEKEIARLRREQKQYLSLRSGLYEDLKGGVITQEEFRVLRSLYEKRYRAMESKIKKQEAALHRLLTSGKASDVKSGRLKEELTLEALDRSALISFIERIQVYEDKRLIIRFRYRDMFQAAVIAAFADGRGKETV